MRYHDRQGDAPDEPRLSMADRGTLFASGGRNSGGPFSASRSRRHGYFLAALPEQSRRDLLARSQRVELPARTLISSLGEQLEHCYFIEQGVISCILRLADGFEGASTMIGPEGFIGIHSMTGTELVAPHDAVVQVHTVAQRLPAVAFREALDETPELLARFLRFNEALRLQLAQSTVCNLHHHLPQRLARWLLMTYDRVDADELALTQESLSALVGANRASVTHAARLLRDAGAIDTQYGRIVLRDWQHLEDISCECYAIVHRHYRRLLD